MTINGDSLHVVVALPLLCQQKIKLTSYMDYFRQTTHGTIRFCRKCNVYHLEFGNISFNFSTNDLNVFRNYINGIDAGYWTRMNRNSENTRKILLPTQLKGTNFCFHANELEELKYLLNPDMQVQGQKRVEQIDYEFSMN